MSSVVQVYGAALVIVVSSLLLGRALCAAAGRHERWWAAPAVGLAALVILSETAIQLPGRSVTAIVVIGLALAVSVAVLARWRVLPVTGGDLLIIGTSLLGPTVQFLASGRAGLQGVSLDNDTDLHLLWAEALRSTRAEHLYGTGGGYPLGPHSVVAAVGTLIGSPLDLGFAALLVAAVCITAVTTAGFVAGESLWRRLATGVLCSLTYLLAAYYAEGAFKEVMMASLLLAFVLHLEQVRSRWLRANDMTRLSLTAPAVLLIVGAFYVYSYLALGWYAATLGVWLVVEVALRPKQMLSWVSWRRLRANGSWMLGTAGLATLLLVPVAKQAATFFNLFGASAAGTGTIPAGVLGNLIGPLSSYEVLGLWPSPDFRTFPANLFQAGELGGLGLAVAVYGLIWVIRRRQLLLLSGVVGSAAIWLYARHSQSPYVAAKAEVILAPLITAMGLRALLTSRVGGAFSRVLRLAVAVLFCAFAAYSSYQALRNEPVQAPEAARELAAFHRTVGEAPVLFLGDDDYAPWQLRTTPVYAVSRQTPGLGFVPTRPSKQWVYAQAIDFDSVDAATLDRYRYVISSSGSYASQVPGNFRLLAGAKLYDLWERTGPTAPRRVIETSGVPGAILDCQSALGRSVEATRGQASVMAPPVTRPGPGLLAGESIAVPLALPRGRWELSIQYLSSFDLMLSAEGMQWPMPAYLGRPGPFFRVGTVVGAGTNSPVILRFTAPRPSIITGRGLFAIAYTIAATRVPDVRRLVPVDKACGRYVDWYRIP